jgi:hypothetical protein
LTAVCVGVSYLRLRPIAITVGATVLALLPLAVRGGPHHLDDFSNGKPSWESEPTLSLYRPLNGLFKGK